MVLAIVLSRIAAARAPMRIMMTVNAANQRAHTWQYIKFVMVPAVWHTKLSARIARTYFLSETLSTIKPTSAPIVGTLTLGPATVGVNENVCHVAPNSGGG